MLSRKEIAKKNLREIGQEYGFSSKTFLKALEYFHQKFVFLKSGSEFKMPLSQADGAKSKNKEINSLFVPKKPDDDNI